MKNNKCIKKLISLEKQRQENYINLIASENYTSTNILNIQSSELSNKYAEGYKNKRYYGGCKYINKIEQLAINRAKKLFNADYANVQPHSGSQANQAIYMALCNPNDTILGMKLTDGGHLSHGHKANFSGKFYNIIQYGIDSTTEYIDYDKIDTLTKKYKPKIIIAGASAYSRIINWNILKLISKKVNAYLIADISHYAGLIASKLYPNPIKIVDAITTSTQKTLRGPRGGLILSKKNKILEKKIDMAVFPGIQGGPLEHIIAAKAICFKEAQSKKFKTYQKQTLTNTKYLKNILEKENFKIISKGTDTHLFLINLKNKNITGIEAEKRLEKANIIVNKNIIPNDKLNSNITSGIRIGTPAITTRGFKSRDIKKIGEWINKIISNKKNIKNIKIKVIKLCKKHPIYK